MTMESVGQGYHEGAVTVEKVVRRETNIRKIRVKKRITYAEAIKVAGEKKNKEHEVGRI